MTRTLRHLSFLIPGGAMIGPHLVALCRGESTVLPPLSPASGPRPLFDGEINKVSDHPSMAPELPDSGRCQDWATSCGPVPGESPACQKFPLSPGAGPRPLLDGETHEEKQWQQNGGGESVKPGGQGQLQTLQYSKANVC